MPSDEDGQGVAQTDDKRSHLIDEHTQFNTGETVTTLDVAAVIEDVTPGTETVSVSIPRSEVRSAVQYTSANESLYVVTNGDTLGFASHHPEEATRPPLSAWDRSPAIAKAFRPSSEDVATKINTTILALEYQSIPGDSEMVTVHVEPERPLVIEGSDGDALVICPLHPDNGVAYNVEEDDAE